ncbi:MAG TPA: FAD-dependent oxidoreductase [Clostridiales bacterium]|nr:FAD-dependent oxidoreductase [Clostridiales bacterium]
MYADICIVGGGISGFTAAVAAARRGEKTLIVEQHGYLGGMLTMAGVGPMMTFHAGEDQVIKGITSELIDRMVKKNKSPGHVFDTIGYTYTVTPFDAEWMKHEMEMMLLESGGDVLYHSMLAGVDVADGTIRSIQVCNKAGISSITAELFIDATGDGDLSAWAGVKCTIGRESDGACQPMTMNMKMGNVDTEQIKAFVKDHPEEFPYLQGNTWMVDMASHLSVSGFAKTLKKAMDNHEFSGRLEGILFFETNNPGEMLINTSRLHGYDATDPIQLTKAEIEGRKQVRELEAFFKNRIPGFQNAVLLQSGPNVGVRGSRQIKGMYCLTQEDILKATRFEDAIAHAGYPIDVHSPDGKETVVKEDMHIKHGTVYSIPYRCLVNPYVHNLITVGRCISATFEAQGAIRTTPTAGAIGHAGGVAAHLARKQGVKPRDVSIPELQRILKEQGAYLFED